MPIDMLLVILEPEEFSVMRMNALRMDRYCFGLLWCLEFDAFILVFFASFRTWCIHFVYFVSLISIISHVNRSFCNPPNSEQVKKAIRFNFFVISVRWNWFFPVEVLLSLKFIELLFKGSSNRYFLHRFAKDAGHDQHCFTQDPLWHTWSSSYATF